MDRRQQRREPGRCRHSKPRRQRHGTLNMGRNPLRPRSSRFCVSSMCRSSTWTAAAITNVRPNNCFAAAFFSTPADATKGWNTLLTEVGGYATAGQSADRSALLQALARAGIEVKAPRSFQRDIDRLKDLTASTLKGLEEYSRIEVGGQGHHHPAAGGERVRGWRGRWSPARPWPAGRRKIRSPLRAGPYASEEQRCRSACRRSNRGRQSGRLAQRTGPQA